MASTAKQRARWHERITRIQNRISDLAACIREAEGEDSELAQAVAESAVLLDDPWRETRPRGREDAAAAQA